MKKIFTLVIVLLPILSIYETFVPNLSYGDAILIILFPIFLSRIIIRKHLILSKQKTPIVVFLLYIFISFMLQIMLNTGVEVLSTFRYLLYLLYLLIAFDEFDFNYGIKALGKVTIAISVYVIVQFLYFYIFATTLPWYIFGTNVMDYGIIARENSDYYLTFYRPTGLFMEPTHFAQYVVVYLTFLLLFNFQEKPKIVSITIISIALLVSASSLGFIYLLLIWLLWFILKQKYKVSIKSILLTITLVFFLTQVIMSVEYFEKIITRVFVDKSFSGAAVGYRFNSLIFFKETDIPLVNWLIGFGRGTEKSYFTGVFYFLINNGIIGLLIYFWITMNAFFTNRGFFRWLTLIVFVLSIGSEFIANFGILYYYSFIYSKPPLCYENNQNLLIRKELVD